MDRSEEKWDQSAQQRFYDHYRQLAGPQQAEALFAKAQELSELEQEEALKGAESLLLMWLSKHYHSESAPKIYQLIAQLCRKMGDTVRADYFNDQLRVLKQESGDLDNR